MVLQKSDQRVSSLSQEYKVGSICALVVLARLDLLASWLLDYQLHHLVWHFEFPALVQEIADPAYHLFIEGKQETTNQKEVLLTLQLQLQLPLAG